ncbi:MAG TPA: aspartate/glutamate racemase family protein [Phycisphaerae bacterium]|nr:aspartate/glutamate racemase family protein [Phycisphaerae bacterium]
MKTIGLIGGMSWESSIEYYRIINESIRDRLGPLRSAKCVMYSFDFEEVVVLQRREAWDEATRRMIEAAKAVERAGADFIAICTNTMHKMAPSVQAAVGVPLLHIVDPAAREVKARGLRRIGLLATRFTMEQDFYTGRLVREHGLEVIIPDAPDRQLVHDIIFNELCCGEIRDASRQELRRVIGCLQDKGAEGVILGCTELGLLIKQADSPLPLFDTTVLHAKAAAELAVS